MGVSPPKRTKPVWQKTLRARALRQNATDAEKGLWNALREAGLPWNIRRQHPVGRFIVDFAIPARRLVIEIDGGQHAVRKDADALRTAELEQQGCRVIRFWNNDVLGNTAGVLEEILSALHEHPTSP